MTISLPRRTCTLAALLASGALVWTGCGADGSVDSDASTQAGGATQNGDAGSEGQYPVTLETVYGEITLEEKPERVVAIGGDYIDQLTALGVDLAGYVGSPRAGEDFAIGYPWLAESGLDPEAHDLGLLAEGYSPSVEAVAALEPDLILGSGAEWAIDEAMNEQMQQIAPTYTSPHDFTDWQDTFTDLAQLTGTESEVEPALAEVDTAFDAAAEQLSTLEGGSYVFADVSDQEVTLSTTLPELERLGLVPEESLLDVDALSLEQLDQLTADVLYIMTWRQDDTQETLEADPRFSELPAVQGDAVVYADATLTNALADVGPNSIQWWLDGVVSQLEDAELTSSDS